MLGHVPDFLSAILFFLVAAASIWVFTTDYSKRSAIAGLASGQWRELALEWERLWYDLDDLNGEEIVGRMRALQQRERIVSAEAQCGPDDDGLNERCAEEAYAVLAARFPS